MRSRGGAEAPANGVWSASRVALHVRARGTPCCELGERLALVEDPGDRKQGILSGK